MSNPSCDPLLITKRPTATLAPENSHRGISIPMECRGTEGRVSQLPKMLRAALNAASWQRRRRSRGKSKLETRSKVNKRDLLKNHSMDTNEIFKTKKHNSREKSKNSEVFHENRETIFKDCGARGLECEYYEHLETLKFLLSPPQSFADSWNSCNKLNSLDFQRMNTIAIPDESSWNIGKFHKKNFDVTEREMRARYFLDSVDRVIRDDRKIEEVMMTILQREPVIHKKLAKSCLTREISPTSPKETKTVRFQINHDNNDKINSENLYLIDKTANEKILKQVPNRNDVEKKNLGQLKRMSSLVNIFPDPINLPSINNFNKQTTDHDNLEIPADVKDLEGIIIH